MLAGMEMVHDGFVKLEARLARCGQTLHLGIGPRLQGGHRSDVFRCTTPDGTEAVLKLTATSGECAAEAAALSAWKPSGAAACLRAVDLGADALLLDLLMPGTPLAGGQMEDAVHVASHLLACLHGEPASSAFIPLSAGYGDFERRSRNDAAREQDVLGNPEPPGLALLPRARAAMRRLCATTATNILLHGDFCDKNLLLHGEAYVAIDPIPMFGDPCSDVGFFAAYHPPASTAFECATGIASLMGYDEVRAARWTAVWLVHQACESWRADAHDVHAVASGRQVALGLDG